MAQFATSKRMKAIESILSGATMQQAASAAGVSRSTLYRWLDDPFFNDDLNAAKSELVDRVGTRLINLAEKATGILDRFLNDPGVSDSAKWRPALQILDRAIQFQDKVDLIKRLSRWERLLNDFEASEAAKARIASMDAGTPKTLEFMESIDLR